jgi:twitching motility protein PilT
VRTLEELQIPPIVAKLSEEKRGLILVTGATGSGKSTTMAAIIDRVNRFSASHIITIEDPIEFLITDQRSIVEQREVGIDTKSFSAAVKSALRQNPDLIMIGELRDQETVKTALQAAETGHLVISTLHTNDAAETIHRLLGMFDAEAGRSIQKSFAQSLKAVISQRLVTRLSGQGMIAVQEILIGSPLVRESIEKGEFYKLRGIIKEGRDKWGMQTFDQALVDLYQKRLISKETALRNATSESEVELMMSGIVER